MRRVMRAWPKAGQPRALRRVGGGVCAAVALLLGACSAVPVPSASGTAATKPGGYYQDDGPGTPPPDLEAVPDAVPRDEPLSATANRPYSVFGVNYVPQTQVPAYRARGMASWYGKKFHGRRTASGERYDMYAMTAAHPTLPIPSYVRVTNLKNGRSVVVRINDRGPFLHRRLIDLSYAAAHKLDYARLGTAQVEVQRVFPDDDPVPVLAQSGPPPSRNQPRRDDEPPPIVARTRPALAAPAVAAAPALAVLADASGSAVAVSAVAAAAPVAAVAPAAEESPELDPPASLTLETLTETPAPVVPEPAVAPLERPSRPAEPAAVWLQLGAFSSRANAEEALARAQQVVVGRGAGLTLVQRGALWRLHMGPWTDRAEAQAMAERLAARGLVRPVLVAP